MVATLIHYIDNEIYMIIVIFRYGYRNIVDCTNGWPSDSFVKMKDHSNLVNRKESQQQSIIPGCIVKEIESIDNDFTSSFFFVSFVSSSAQFYSQTFYRGSTKCMSTHKKKYIHYFYTRFNIKYLSSVDLLLADQQWRCSNTINYSKSPTKTLEWFLMLFVCVFLLLNRSLLYVYFHSFLFLAIRFNYDGNFIYLTRFSLNGGYLKTKSK